MGSAPRGQSGGRQCHSLLAGPRQYHQSLGAGPTPSPPPSSGVLEAGNVYAQSLGTVLPLASHNVSPECRGCCGSHRGLQGMCRGGGQKPDLREGREWRPVSQWVMLLLLLNLTPSPEQREIWRAKAPAPLAPLIICIGHSAPPPLEAITPSRLQPLDPWGGQGLPSAPTQAPQGVGRALPLCPAEQ